jgi:alcohol dehydrogenase class IV
MIEPFSFARTPQIIFGAGTFGKISNILREYGKTVLIVTGGSSFRSSNAWDNLTQALTGDSVNHFHVAVEGEPSPDLVDRAVAEYKSKSIEVVVACGGGSVIDAGKAISAMLPTGGSVLDYLEGIGTGADHDGSKVPFVAVPTTSGTGSEATKNSVLSRVGPGGFKKSLRHDNFVPDVALVDPSLTISCPSHITAACGLDAFTQLLESYVSTNASPMTDALALNGIELTGKCLMPACAHGSRDIGVRAGMSCAALMSGITLANAGLGVVHGLASTIGGRFDIPHGVVCGTLIGAATSVTITKLMNEHGVEHPALNKYARAGFSLHGVRETGVAQGCEMLVEKVNQWIETLQIPRLSAYDIREKDLDSIVSGTSNKNNPVPLGKDEIRDILRMRTG